MYALPLEAKTPSAQRGLRTEQSPLRGFVYSVKWVDKYQIGTNGSINNYHFTVELVLTEGEIVQYGTTTGGFQQNFGVFTNFNNVFYDLLLSYFMPGFEQICRVANYREKIQLSTTVLQYLQPDLSFSLTLALPLACWTSPTSTSWVSDVFKLDRSSSIQILTAHEGNCAK